MLVKELHKAASESKTSPEKFAAETLEAGLAARRLPKIPSAAYGARVPGSASGWQPSTLPEDEPVAFENPLGPADVPTLTELESVSDIT